MKNIYRILTLTLIGFLILGSAYTSFAGNDNRRGTNGVAQLLINPWAKSAGWAGVNTANGNGIDALYTNVAGLTGTPQKIEVNYAYTNWANSSGIGINAFGAAVRIGESGVAALSLVSVGVGDENITTTSSPENGTNGLYSPTEMNINVAYAHSFSHSIHGGANIKIISSGIDNVSGMGFAIDAGIRYITGDADQFKFGLALKNIGPNMSYSGDGLSVQMDMANGEKKTVEYRSGSIEMPTLLNIGASYDFLFEKDQRVTLAANFTSNAFGRDDYIVGLEYAFFKYFQVRAGYDFEEGIFSNDNVATFMSGLSAGVSIQAPLMKKREVKGKDGKKEQKPVPMISVDYAYRTSKPFNGSHTIGLGLFF